MPVPSLSLTTPDETVVHELADGTGIGRADGCDVVLPDRTVSRRHARISADDDGWWLEDLDSRSGTWLNGRRIEGRERLAVGDRIGVGRSVLRVVETEGGAEPPRPAAPVSSGTTIFRRAEELLSSVRTSAADEDELAVLRRHAERLELLNEVHEALGRSPGLDELFEMILDCAFRALGPEEALLALRDGPGEYRTVATRRSPGVPGETPLSQTLSEEVIEKRQAALFGDLGADQRFGDAASLMSAGVRSLIAAPLFDGDGPLGMLALTSRARVHPLTEDDLELLTSLAAIASLRIRNVALAHEAAERRRLEQELELARSIQVGLMPRRLPEPRGWSLFASCLPSHRVSGDFYLLGERQGALDALVVDVAGKGIAAALLTASLEALLAGPLSGGLAPEEVLARVSGLLYQRTPAAKYATALLARVELAGGRLVVASAGHLPALAVRHDGSVDSIGSTGPLLGLLPGSDFTVAEDELAPGELIAAFTDGLVEVTDSEGTELGLERLAETLCAWRHRPLAEIATAIQRAIASFAGAEPDTDDRTLVLLRRDATTA